MGEGTSRREFVTKALYGAVSVPFAARLSRIGLTSPAASAPRTFLEPFDYEGVTLSEGPLAAQLSQFQHSRRRFGFVVDEYGEIRGLVTLEDLLEEIVGEFTTDAASLVHRHVHREAGGTYLVNAGATIRALNRAMQWHLPTDGPRTLNQRPWKSM